jgi:hypothetical protein
MYLSVLNPWGQYTSLDLDNMPAWRLELAALALPPDDLNPPSKTWLGVVLRYTSMGTTAATAIVAMSVKASGPSAEKIAAVGFPFLELHANKDRLKEAAKILVNTDLAQKEYESINARLPGLVDAYHNVLKALAMPDPTPLGDVEPLALGEFEGWRYALTKMRYEPWLRRLESNGASAISVAPPGKAASEPRISREQRRAAAPVGDMLPPPGDPPAPETAPAG